MGKRKRHTEKQATNDHAQQDADQISLFKNVEVATKKQDEATNLTSNHQHYEQESAMSLTEFAKKPSLTDWLLSAFTGLLVACMVFQIVIMDSQLDSARKDQRPWLQIVLGAQTPADRDTAVPIQIAVNNTGKTPAKGIDVKFFIEVVKNGDAPQLAGTSKFAEMTTGILYPNSPQYENLKYDMLESQMDDYEAGRSFLALYSTGSYVDAYKTDHWTRTCFFASTKQTGFTAEKCTSYNDADSN